MFGYQYLVLANHCHTTLWTVKMTVAQQVTALFYHQKCCFNKQLSNSTSLLHSLVFPCTNVPSVSTHTTYLHISCPVSYWSHHKAVSSPSPRYQYSLYSATLLLSVATPQSLCSQKNTQWPTCFHALLEDNFRKAGILLLGSAALLQCTDSCQ